MTADDDYPLALWDEITNERRRAHAKHGAKSMESESPRSHRRCTILTEEVGEVARCLNDIEQLPVGVAAFDDDVIADARQLRQKIRDELVQVAAMAVAWIDALDGRHLS